MAISVEQASVFKALRTFHTVHPHEAYSCCQETPGELSEVRVKGKRSEENSGKQVPSVNAVIVRVSLSNPQKRSSTSPRTGYTGLAI